MIFASWSLSFFRYKLRTRIPPSSLVVIRIKGNVHKTALEMVEFPEHFLILGSGQLLWEMLGGFLALGGFTWVKSPCDLQFQCSISPWQLDTVLEVIELEESWGSPHRERNTHPGIRGPVFVLVFLYSCVFMALKWLQSGLVINQGFHSPSINRELWEWVLARNHHRLRGGGCAWWRVPLPHLPLAVSIWI